jgi:predicted peptidase
MKQFILSLGLAIVAAFTGTPVHASTLDAYLPFQFQSASEQTLPYRLLLPQNYNPKIKYPMVVWLHGSGEVGNDNAKQLDNGAEVFVNPSVRGQYPAIVLVPQCPSDDRWSNMSSAFSSTEDRMAAAPTRTAQSTFELITAIRKAYNISSIRIVGLSMGGFGAWDWIVRRPDLFSKALPMSAGGDVTQAHHLVNTPIWAFHGNKDDVVGVSHSRDMIAAIRAAGGKPLYTEIQGGGHGPWSPIIAKPTVLAWLFGN